MRLFFSSPDEWLVSALAWVGLCASVDVAGPWFTSGVGVKVCDLVAVAKCIGDQWWRCDEEVLVQGRVACAAQFNSEAT